MLIGAITILARVAGFAKQLVFAKTVGTDCLSTAYFTANQIPNIVFEVVVGGALAGVVVPVLAGAAARSASPAAHVGRSVPPDAPAARSTGDPMASRAADGGRLDASTARAGDGSGARAVADSLEARAEAGRISSALLTWVLVVLVPLGALTALLAGPIIGLFFSDSLKGCDVDAVSAIATRMLVVFAPQIPLYGVAVVLYGVLQAHRRFAGPAVAPLVSSIMVIVAYLLFVPLNANPSGLVTPAAELMLSLGTSLGVLALVVTVIGPTLGFGLRWRPTLRFPDGVAVQVRRLAMAGVAALLAQQAAMIVVVLLSNEIGGGALAVYNYAWAVYLVPYAVLAVPIATSAFPGLSARAQEGDTVGFAGLAARTTRAVVLVSGVAAGVLAAVSGPVAVVFLDFGSRVPVQDFARAIALFAPGLIGYGLIAHLSRVLYAAGRGRAAATGTVIGWIVVMVSQTIFVLAFPADWQIAGLALGMSVGMTVGGALLLASVARARGSAAVTGLARATGAAVAGGAAGYAAGASVAGWLGATGTWANVGATAVAGLAAAAVGVALTAAMDRPDARALLGMVLRRRGGGSGGPDG